MPPCVQAGKGIADKVAALLHYWEGKYKHLWEQDKDAYMRCASQDGCGMLCWSTSDSKKSRTQFRGQMGSTTQASDRPLTLEHALSRAAAGQYSA